MDFWMIAFQCEPITLWSGFLISVFQVKYLAYEDIFKNVFYMLLFSKQNEQCEAHNGYRVNIM